jgi:ketosteroid isomerase-like protein
MAGSVDRTTNHERTLEIFRLKAETGGNEALLAALDDDVRWTIPGSCCASRTYEGKADLVEGILAPLGRRLEGAVRSRVHEVLDAGDTIIVRWRGEGRTTWGEPYENEYCWHLTWNAGRIVRVVAYLDTLLLEHVMSREPAIRSS